jgi:hypothetical protein
LTDGGISTDPSPELLQLLSMGGPCTHCIAVYGATRRTKLSDFIVSNSSPNDVEDTDPTHAKQVNYRSMMALTKACRQQSPVTHIVRVTGKGEDPTSFFTVLINGLGGFAKGWNYEGEQVLRTAATADGVPYTIVRPGVMKDTYEPSENERLVLADNGGDLPVSAVSYAQIASLLVECVLHRQSRNVTLCAMNVKGSDGDEDHDDDDRRSLAERVQALRPDTRQFPTTLIEQHKKAVYRAAITVLTLIGAGILAVLTKLVVPFGK